MLLATLPLHAGPPDWEVDPTGYQYSANINAQLNIDGVVSTSLSDRVAFFVGNEIRGVGVPVSVEQSIYHFTTVYSNIPLGEQMTMKVYVAQNDQVYDAYNTYTFTLQAITGSFTKPFQVLVRRDGDFPISINNDIPDQMTLQGVPFESLDMAPFVEQIDDDPISWSVSPNTFVSASFNGSVLSVIPTDPNWTGTTLLTITAREQSINQFFAEVIILYEVKPSYLGPAWDIFLGESVLPGQNFTDYLLEDLEIQYEGSCLEYSLSPLFDINTNPQTRPDWEADPNSTPTSMPIIARVAFTDQYFFDDPEDLLGAFIDGELRGVAAPTIIDGNPYYFLQVQNEIPGVEISLQFYSGELQETFTLPITLPYVGIEGLGNVDSPLILDFSPFQFDIGEDTQTSVSAQDPSWEGAQAYTFTVADCDYPSVLLDQTVVTYCVGADGDQDGFCDAIDVEPNNPCQPDFIPPPLAVYNELNQVVQPNGFASYSNDTDDCARALTWRLRSVEPCNLPTIDIQISADNPGINPSAAAVLQDANTGTYFLEIYTVVGTNTIQITTTDPNGNSSSLSYRILVEDTQSPSLICQTAQVLLDAEGEGILLPEQALSPLSFDNCGIANLNVNISSFDCNDIGSSVVTVEARDEVGNVSNCTATVNIAPSGDLPSSWSSTDIGQVTTGNDFSFDPCSAPVPEDGEFMVVGSGNNATSSTTDNVAFASYAICGNGSITAKVESISSNGYGGLMIRESNAPGAKQVSVFSNMSSILRHETRYSTNAPKQISSFFKPSPFWLRLERQGSWIFAYYSTNGFSFQYVHGVFVPMQDCIEIGLASFTYLPWQQTEATFSNVSIQGTNGWGTDQLSEDFGINSPIIEMESANLTVYPNPAGEHIHLSINLMEALIDEVQLYNAMGQLIERKLGSDLSAQSSWSLEGLPDGVHFFKLLGKTRSDEVIQFVKMR
jgi:regulation of enolase protein 1 (concanavalin A-like superfamily)